MKRKQRMPIGCGVAVIVLLTAVYSMSALGDQPVKAYIATVNGAGITIRDFKWADSLAEQKEARSGKPVDAVRFAEIKKIILESLINRELLFQESKKKGIVIGEPEVTPAYNSLIEDMPREIDLETFFKELDFSEEKIKDELRRVIAIQRLLDQELAIDDTVSEKEMKNFYDSNIGQFIIPGPVHASHILIKADLKSNESKNAQARKQIETIQERLRNGEDFAKMAKMYSQGPSGIKGGDIGWLRHGQTVRPFEAAAFALEPGEISDIVETRFGYHLIKMLEKRPETIIAYQDVKDTLMEHLIQEKVNAIQTAYINKLKQSAAIEIFKEQMKTF